MGNRTSTPEPDPEPEQPEPEPEPEPEPVLVEEEPGGYIWPENLYVETRDMAAAAFLAYSFGYVLDVARKSGGLVGIDVDNETGIAKRSVSTSFLSRSFSPSEVASIIEDNKDSLAKAFPEEFTKPEALQKSLRLLQERAESSGMKRPLTLIEYDDKHQQHEMVYAVAKDDINKRITLVFRGTENELALRTNWSTNLYIAKTKVPVPEYLKNKVDFDNLWIHSGFYKYVFEKTFDDSDDPNRLKYHEVLDDIKPLLKENPSYKLYVTGHSLGGALAGLISFFLACDPEIVTPVTCLNFASPRFGDSNYLEAVQVLEKGRRLRFCRIVNDNDSIAMVPMWYYSHAGFQVRLYENSSHPTDITYPKINDIISNQWNRTWSNSLFASANLTYDHGSYRERVEQNKSYLEKENLNHLYRNKALTGFD
jgi:predicted lipase